MKPKEHELEDFGRSFVLQYHQSWGQGIEKRLEMLNKAVEIAGIKARFIQENGKSGWTGEDIEELERAKKFRKELEASFPLGEFYTEARAVVSIINKYSSPRRNRIRRS